MQGTLQVTKGMQGGGFGCTQTLLLHARASVAYFWQKLDLPDLIVRSKLQMRSLGSSESLHSWVAGGALLDREHAEVVSAVLTCPWPTQVLQRPLPCTGVYPCVKLYEPGQRQCHAGQVGQNFCSAQHLIAVLELQSFDKSNGGQCRTITRQAFADLTRTTVRVLHLAELVVLGCCLQKPAFAVEHAGIAGLVLQFQPQVLHAASMQSSNVAGGHKAHRNTTPG